MEVEKLTKGARRNLPKWCKVVRYLPSVYERTVVIPEGLSVRSPREAVGLVSGFLNAQEQEHFVVVLLNAQHRCIGLVDVTTGLLNTSLVHPREVFRVAIVMNAAAVILAHNHPSGDPSPSIDDRAVTDQLVAAGRLLDIPVHDHLIIAGVRYTSFAEEGLL